MGEYNYLISSGESIAPKLNTTESQYQDLINRLINSKPIKTIDPLQRMLSAISGSSALQTTNLPQSNRLGQMFSDGTNAFANAIETKNKDLRLWDTEQVNLLHNLLANETARTKAEVEAKRLAEEHVFKANEDKRQEAVAKEKGRASDTLGKIGDILNPKDTVDMSLSNRMIGNEPSGMTSPHVYNKTPDYNAAINLAAGIGNTSLMERINQLQHPSPIEYKPSTEEGKVDLEKKIATAKEEAKRKTNDTSSTKNYEKYKRDEVAKVLTKENFEYSNIDEILKSPSRLYATIKHYKIPITSYNDWRKENANLFGNNLLERLGVTGGQETKTTQEYNYIDGVMVKKK